MVQLHNCFPFTPLIMKIDINMQTPDDLRMYPYAFWFKGHGHNVLITKNEKVR